MKDYGIASVPTTVIDKSIKVVPTCLLNVRLVLRPVNVPIAHGRNVAASAAVRG